MSGSSVYAVVASGDLVEGFERGNVVEAFGELFSVTPDKADAFVGKRKIVKRNLSLQQAEQYQDRLGTIGIDAILEEQEAANDSSVAPKTGSADVSAKKASASQSASPVLGLIPESTTDAVDPNSIVCPKCQLSQDKSEQCTGCGVFFNKVGQAASARADNAQASGAKAAQRLKERKAPVIDESDSMPVTAFLFPVIAAIVGAFIWKLIAVSMGYELGLVAWGIGGAVGFAAAVAGGSGDKVGVVCAVLALLAIFGGKYLTYSSFQDQILENLPAELEMADEDLRPLYDEEKVDAAGFERINKANDSSVKAYMVDHAFTDVESAEYVSDSELQEFREYHVEWLEDFSLNQPDFATWKSERYDSLENIFEGESTTQIVFNSLGILDILFLFLGVSTAWQIGRAGQS